MKRTARPAGNRLPAECSEMASTPGADARILDELAAEARYARQRYDLYRAKIYSGRPTSQTRLRELQRLWESAEARLDEARAARRPGAA